MLFVKQNTNKLPTKNGFKTSSTFRYVSDLQQMSTSPAVSQMSSPGIPVDRTNNHIGPNNGTGNSGGNGGGTGANGGTNNTPNSTINSNANSNTDQLLNGGSDFPNRTTLVLTNPTSDNRNGLNVLNTNGPTDRTSNGIVTIDRSHIDMNPISGINLNDRLIQERNRQLQERALQERVLHERVLQERVLHERVLQDGPRLA